MERKANLDTVRGIACVLLVFYHTAGPDAQSGLRLEPGSAYGAFNHTLSYVRMPLFTFLSGAIYALRPVSPGGERQFAAGKLKRLLIPFLCITLIFMTAQMLIPGVNHLPSWSGIPQALIWPYGHLWFIVALIFWTFALVGTLDYFRALDDQVFVLTLFLVACVLYGFSYGPVGAFAWNRALYLLPYFVAGLMVTRFGMGWTLICVAMSLLALRWQVSIGVGFRAFLLATMPAVPLLARLGLFSYSIYLLHIFGSAASRIAMTALGVDSIPVLLFTGTLAGLLLPVGAHLVLVRIPYVSRALLGVRSVPIAKRSIRTT